MSLVAEVIESRALKTAWQKFGTPLIVLKLAFAVIVILTRNWNGWEGARAEQVTNDAYVRGDLTPLSTKVPGIVREVKVNDYQIAHKGDVLVQLDDDDYRAQGAQAVAGVEAARSRSTKTLSSMVSASQSHNANETVRSLNVYTPFK